MGGQQGLQEESYSEERAGWRVVASAKDAKRLNGRLRPGGAKYFLPGSQRDVQGAWILLYPMIELRLFSTISVLDLPASSCQAAACAMPTPKPLTILFNKPYDVLPSFTDPEGRPTLADFIDLPGVYAAGRLDRDSEGLMLLTSDGALAHRITDPTHKLPKVYLAQVERIPDEEALNQLRHGVLLSGKRTRPAEVRLLEQEPSLPNRPVPIRFRKNVPTAWLEIVLHEGMNRQVRRMTAAVGHPTLRLVRIAIGPVKIGDLPVGRWRELSSEELRRISPR